MKLHPLQAYNGKELYWFKCTCGNDKFDIYDEVFDERGLTEHGFDCKCGKSYHFAYGYVERVN